MKYMGMQCNKKNCPIQHDKVRKDCNVLDCPYRTVDVVDDWQIAMQFFAMLFSNLPKEPKEMQDMATPNQHKHIKVMMKSDLGPEVPVIMYSDVFAQSAFDHEVTLEEFKLSLDSFSQSSRSSLPQIQEWRDETTEIFFKLLEESGKVTWKSAEFLGGSDYEEVNETTLDNENKNN